MLYTFSKNRLLLHSRCCVFLSFVYFSLFSWQHVAENIFIPFINYSKYKYGVLHYTNYSSVYFAGAVFVNGKEMTNQLPAVTIGSAITFDMEVVSVFPGNNNNPSDVSSFKLRVTIGSGNREVVFDWLLDQVVDCLFFGCSFTHPGWKVLVF